jgi:tape measure domain-containing protein
MDSITRGYNKALLKGKVDMESLNMIAEAGVPIFNEMSKVMNLSGQKMFKTISSGKVQTSVLTAAFKNMTSEGGIFFKGMEIASGTLSGKISTLKDNVGLAAAELGSTLAPTLKDLTDYLTKVAKQSREWVSQNRELIKTKVTEFVKKIPMYLEQIAYWGPKIAAFVGIFYGITAAIKITNGVMSAFNTLMNINLGPARKAAAFFAKDMPGAVGKSIGAAGKLQSTLGVLSAAVAGWGIGTVLYEKLVDPLIEAQAKLEELANEVADTMGRDKSKRSTAQLSKDLAKVNKVEKDLNTGFTGIGLNYLPDITGAFGMFEKMAKSSIKIERGDIKSEIEQRAIAAEFDVTNPGAAMVTPSVSSSRSEQVVKHQVEMTINDSSGKATVKSGRTGPGFQLKHTGTVQ